MKTLAPLTQDGFKASIELLRFQREQNNDLIHAITSIVGTAPTFIKGGDITQAGGNTTITSGIVCYNEKLYTFTGGTYAGTPATLKVLFEENTSAGYPQPYFVGDPIPKNIYLSRTARIDATGTLFLSTLGTIKPLDYITQKALSVDSKANKNGFVEITQPLTLNKCTSSALVFRYYDNGFIYFRALLTANAAISTNEWLVRGLPNSLSGFSLHSASFWSLNPLLTIPQSSRTVLLSPSTSPNAYTTQLSLQSGTLSATNCILIEITYPIYI